MINRHRHDYNDDCIPDVCDVATGACCDPEIIACTDETEYECISMNGIYAGDGRSCSKVCERDPFVECDSPDDCVVCCGGGDCILPPTFPCATGACCGPGSECTEENKDDCTGVIGGEFQGYGTECERGECQPIDVVFLFDTSRSMDEFPSNLAQLCDRVQDALDQVQTEGICVRSEKLGIRSPGDAHCPSTCCEGSVGLTYGARACDYFDVARLGTCGGCNQGDCEDWGTATAIVAAEKDWTPGPRIIVAIADGGPRCGGGPGDWADPVIDDADCAAIHHAILALWDNRVILVTIAGNRVC